MHLCWKTKHFGQLENYFCDVMFQIYLFACLFINYLDPPLGVFIHSLS